MGSRERHVICVAVCAMTVPFRMHRRKTVQRPRLSLHSNVEVVRELFWRTVTCNGHHGLVAGLRCGEFRDRMVTKTVEAESIGRCLNITTVCSSSTPRVPNLAAAFISSVRPCDFQQVRPNAYRFYLPRLRTRAGFSPLVAMAPPQRWEDVKLSPNWSRIRRMV
jgi:hypothetical protein